MDLEHVSFVASWWLMLCVICAMCVIMFLQNTGIVFVKKDDGE